jgi:hypothetical protein
MVLEFHTRLAFAIKSFFKIFVLNNLSNLTLLAKQSQLFFFKVILTNNQMFIQDFDRTCHCTLKPEIVLSQQLMDDSV